MIYTPILLAILAVAYYGLAKFADRVLPVHRNLEFELAR